MTVGIGQVAAGRRGRAVNRLLEPPEPFGFWIPARDVAAQQWMISPAAIVDHDEGKHVPAVDQIPILAGFQVENHEVAALRAVVGAGGDIRDATRFVGRMLMMPWCGIAIGYTRVLPVLGSKTIGYPPG